MDNGCQSSWQKNLNVMRNMSIAKEALASTRRNEAIEKGINDNMKQAYDMRGEAINIDIESWRWETPARVKGCATGSLWLAAKKRPHIVHIFGGST